MLLILVICIYNDDASQYYYTLLLWQIETFSSLWGRAVMGRVTVCQSPFWAAVPLNFQGLSLLVASASVPLYTFQKFPHLKTAASPPCV